MSRVGRRNICIQGNCKLQLSTLFRSCKTHGTGEVLSWIQLQLFVSTLTGIWRRRKAPKIETCKPPQAEDEFLRWTAHLLQELPDFLCVLGSINVPQSSGLFSAFSETLDGQFIRVPILDGLQHFCGKQHQQLHYRILPLATEISPQTPLKFYLLPDQPGLWGCPRKPWRWLHQTHPSAGLLCHIFCPLVLLSLGEESKGVKRSSRSISKTKKWHTTVRSTFWEDSSAFTSTNKCFQNSNLLSIQDLAPSCGFPSDLLTGWHRSMYLCLACMIYESHVLVLLEKGFYSSLG